jgi:hypothetical protein
VHSPKSPHHLPRGLFGFPLARGGLGAAQTSGAIPFRLSSRPSVRRPAIIADRVEHLGGAVVRFGDHLVQGHFTLYLLSSPITACATH